MKIFNSASKLVFIITSIAVTVLTFIGKIDPKDFMMLASMVYSYYFTQRKDDNLPPPQVA